MPKIYLSPPYHKWNPCAVTGCDETTHNNLYLDELEVYLKANNIDYKRGPRRIPKSDEDGTALMIKAVKESNAYAPDIHYVSHTNASNSTVKGYRPIIYPGYSEAERLAGIITEKRKEIYGGPITINKSTELYELYATSAIAYYEEHIFHDNNEDANWFHNNMRKIAEQTCKAFCQYFDISYKDPYEESKAKYRVRKSADDIDSQVGAFAVLQNAVEKAKITGLNVYDLSGNLVWEYKEEQGVEQNKEEPKTQVNEKKEVSFFLSLINKILEFILSLFHKN